MEHFDIVTGPVAALDRNNVDTDQIIPKQFLKRIERTGYGQFLFWDWAKEEDFPLNRPEYERAPILVTGANFGCGSSREHAAWALGGRGFRAVIAPSFGDIFRSNCAKNGLLTVDLPEADVRELMEAAPAVATVDLERCVVTMPSGREVEFEVDEDVRYRLLGGHDDIGLTLQRADAIDEHERDRERPGPSTLAL
jgi:3-isopropylmalate/(R)-2-methylmalate dehydratase small subunit